MKTVLSTPKALIFDLGGVIVPLDFSRAYASMEPVCGIPAAEIPRRIAATGLVERYERGEIASERFAAELLASLGLQLSHAEFLSLWNRIFGASPLLPPGLFRSLRERFRLVLLSNTNPIHFDALSERHPLLGDFHHHVLSYRVGALKPDPAIYREAVRLAGCAPEECFFTDDVLPYVIAARAEGIDAVQFTGPAQLEAELRLRGVEW